MKMKTWAFRIFLAGVIGSMAGLAQAQMVGLPVMDTASPRDMGNLEVTPGAMFGRDMDFYGVRTTLSLAEAFRTFLDLGQVDLVDGDSNFGIQAGGLYSLEPTEMGNLGIRGAAYYSKINQLGLTGANGMLVFSDETLLDHLFFYGGAGLDVVFKSMDNPGGENTTQTEINPAVSLGLSFQFSENFSLFVEGDYIDGPYIGAGLSIR